eukprot:c42783_g1_i1 orf=46-252(+)
MWNWVARIHNTYTHAGVRRARVHTHTHTQVPIGLSNIDQFEACGQAFGGIQHLSRPTQVERTLCKRDC